MLVFFFESLKEGNPDLLMLFVLKDVKLLKPVLLGAIPQSYLRGCRPGYHSQFGSNKTLFITITDDLVVFPLGTKLTAGEAHAAM